LERSLVSHPCIILSPTGQLREPMGRSSQPLRNVFSSRRRENG
jgi:hypothetical protein